MLILFGLAESGGFGEEREAAGIATVALCTCDLEGMKSVSSTAFTGSSQSCQGTTAFPERDFCAHAKWKRPEGSSVQDGLS